MTYKFFVAGVPAPGGSKTSYGRGRIVDACKRNPAWKSLVALTASQAGCVPLEGPLVLTLTFYMPRPKGHRRKDGTLKPSAPAYPTVKPDTTKLIRSLEDALTGICWKDDTQIVTQIADKFYATDRVGALVTIDRMEDE
jgi:Holliday junction resolvase RusA-like endonuclease